MSSPAIERILRGPSGLGTSGLQFRSQVPTPEVPEPAAPAAGLPGSAVPAAGTAVPDVAVPDAVVPDVAAPELPAPDLAVPGVTVPETPGFQVPSGHVLPVPSALTATPPPILESPAAHGPAVVVPSGKPRSGDPIPGLYHHPVAEPDPVRVEALSAELKVWAMEEIELYPPEWERDFDGFSTGRYMVACHPDAPSVDHLMLAARLMVAENAVDDCYCEDLGGSPIGLGSRLLLAHTALDPLHTTPEYHPDWEASLSSDAPRRAYHSAMEYFTRAATPSQSDRFRHDMARLHLGYLAEASWDQADHVPEVWEYLAMRQFNNFRPCPTITDTVGGYELPAELHALPAMQRVIALAGNATTIVNDLYSYMKELASPGLHLNLPVVISEREGVSRKEGYLKAVEVHNELMQAFEAEAAALAVSCPVPALVRFLRGVAAWVDGNHYWHQTNTYRYTLPDFW